MNMRKECKIFKLLIQMKKVILRELKEFKNKRFKTKEKRSEIKSELDRKKDRQRNLLPAKTGIMILLLTILASIIYAVLYGMTSQNFDVYTRSYYLGFVNDLFPCFISPMKVVFEAPVIRRQINNFFLLLLKVKDIL